MLINSHPDNDHLQGIGRAAEEIPFKIIAVPKSLVNAEEYDLLKQTAMNKKIALQGLSVGQEVEFE